MPQVEIKPPEFSFQWIFIDFILFGLFGFFVLFLYSRFTFLHWSRYGVYYLIPYFPGGNLNDFILGDKSFATVFRELYELGKSLKLKISGIYLFTRPAVVVNDPELIKTILITDFEFFEDRGIFYNGIHDPIAAYSSQITGSKWHGHSDLFSEHLLQKLIIDIRECLQTSCKNFPSTNINDVNINNLVLDLMSPILGNTTFGLKYDPTIDEEIKKLYTSSQPKWKILTNFCFGVYPEISMFSNLITKFIKLSPDVSFVNNNQLKLNENFDKVWMKIQSNDEPKKYDQDYENLSRSFQFFFNCFQMLNPVIIFTLYELAKNLDIQNNLRKEINKVFYKIEDLNYENLLKKFTYLDMILKETLRKYPVNPLINRICIKDYKVENSRQIINKGALIYIPVFGIHNDTEYYPNPEQFDPERFANDKTIKECTYLPFGDGKRTCAGKNFALLHIKLALIMILKQYQLNECPKTSKNIQFNPNIHFLATNQDIWLKLSKNLK